MKLIHLIIVVTSFFTGMSLFAGTVIYSPNLNIEWKTTNSFPEKVWTYKMVPAVFSPETISCLQSIGGFTDKDEKNLGTNGLIFIQGHNNLHISFSEGQIDYYSETRDYSDKDLTANVPDEKKCFDLTTNLLPKIGISLSELSKDTNGQPNLTYDEAEQTFYANSNTAITNVPYRNAKFIRSIDGIDFDWFGGHGYIRYGENGKIIGMLIDWRKLEPVKCYDVPSKEKFIKWIRNGKAIAGPVDGDWGRNIVIDWTKVQKMTVDFAHINYFGDKLIGQQENSAGYVEPLITLGVRIEYGTNEYKLGIRCPIIDK